MKGKSLIGRKCEYKGKDETIWDGSDCTCEGYDKRDGYMCACGDWHEMARPMAREMTPKSKPTKKPAPAKWAPLDLREMWGIGPKTTRAQILDILLKTEETLNAYGRENARLKARLAKGVK